MSTSTRKSMDGVEPAGRTTRYEPAGTVQQAQTGASVEGATQAETASEAALFATGPGPRLFGEGSYLSGGSTAEGNFALPDPNPRGGYGSFDDAGGFGSAELLGTEPKETRRP